MDSDTLMGYQINGVVEIIDKGLEYESLLSEFSRKEIDLSTRRIIEGVWRGKRHESYEVTLPERFCGF